MQSGVVLCSAKCALFKFETCFMLYNLTQILCKHCRKYGVVGWVMEFIKDMSYLLVFISVARFFKSGKFLGCDSLKSICRFMELLYVLCHNQTLD